MPVGDKCPKCGALTLVYESEYNRHVCLKLQCGYEEYKDGRKLVNTPDGSYNYNEGKEDRGDDC